MSTVIQQGKTLVVHVKWATRPDGETDWNTGNAHIADVEPDVEDSTRATVSADEDDCGIVGIYATAEFNGETHTAVLELNVIPGESEDGTIEVER